MIIPVSDILYMEQTGCNRGNLIVLKNSLLGPHKVAVLIIQVIQHYIFSSSGKSFTLESIIAMGLDQFADEISDISGAASKELAIEQALAAIGEQWEDLVLDIDRYKDRGHYRLK